MFKFTKEIEDVNHDSDLFYDLTYGGYIDPHVLLEDKAQADEIVKAGELLKNFFEAINDYFEEVV